MPLPSRHPQYTAPGWRGPLRRAGSARTLDLGTAEPGEGVELRPGQPGLVLAFDGRDVIAAVEGAVVIVTAAQWRWLVAPPEPDRRPRRDPAEARRELCAAARATVAKAR